MNVGDIGNSRGLRIGTAVLLPGLFQIVSVISLALTKSPNDHSDESIWTIGLLILSILIGVFVQGGKTFDRFWKVYSLAILSAALPFSSVAIINFIRGPYGYFWLGVTAFIFIFIIAAVLALPLSGLLYRYLKSELN